jgi:hypothetical protein
LVAVLGAAVIVGTLTAAICIGVNSGPAVLELSSGEAVSTTSSTTPTTEPPSPDPSSKMSPQATALCDRRVAQLAGEENPLHVVLVAAYAATAADVAAADERHHSGGYQSQWRARPSGEFAAVCFFDADAFGVSPRQVERGDLEHFVNRVQEIVRPNGVPWVLAAGRKDSLAVRPLAAGQ